MSAVAAMNRGAQGGGGRQREKLGDIGYRDRSAEFRKALRHSKLVETLKFALPGLALCIFSLYLIPSLLTVKVDNGRGTASAKRISIEAGALKMMNPRVQGVTESKGVYDMIADSATQAARQADLMFLDKVHGKLTAEDGKVSTLEAPDGLYNNKAEEMTFNHGVVVTRSEGLRGDFQTATAYMKKNLVISNTPVVVHLHESIINAEKMTLYTSENRVIFEGNVRTHIVRPPQEAQGAKQTQSEQTVPGSVVGAGAWETGSQ